jgi:cell shape-determining protein MreC
MGRATTTDYVLAAVLQKPPLAAYDELVLDVGSDAALTTGNMVYASGNIPIGKVTEVLAHSSKVLLFSSPEQKFDVLVGSSNIPATAIGKGGGQYEVELPRGAQVSEGDNISIPSLKTNLYGIVSAIISNPSQPFEKILFSAPVNIYQLKWVYVEK